MDHVVDVLIVKRTPHAPQTPNNTMAAHQHHRPAGCLTAHRAGRIGHVRTRKPDPSGRGSAANRQTNTHANARRRLVERAEHGATRAARAARAPNRYAG